MDYIDYFELNYVSYEHIFVDNCNGSVVTGLSKPSMAKASAQNVDWYILLPSIMNEEERLEYLGADYQKITKDTLNAMRKGRVRRDYIDALFWKSDAVDIVKTYFLKKIPFAIVGANRKRVVEQLWAVIIKDAIIPNKRRTGFEDKKNAAILEIESNKELPIGDREQFDAFCLFLAEAFVFAMNREQLLSEELHLSNIVIQVMQDVKNGKMTFLDTLLDSMVKDGLDRFMRRLRETFSDPERGDSLNGSEEDPAYTDDDFRYVALTLKEIYPSLSREQKSKVQRIRETALNTELDQHKKEIGRGRLEELSKKYGVDTSWLLAYDLMNPDADIKFDEIRIAPKDEPEMVTTVRHFDDIDTFFEALRKEFGPSKDE